MSFIIGYILGFISGKYFEDVRNNYKLKKKEMDENEDVFDR